MKILKHYRLSQYTIESINRLAKKLNCNNTEVVERAVELFESDQDNSIKILLEIQDKIKIEMDKINLNKEFTDNQRELIDFYEDVSYRIEQLNIIKQQNDDN